MAAPVTIPAMAPELRLGLPLVVLPPVGIPVEAVKANGVPSSDTVEILNDLGNVLVTVTIEGEGPM
jgi:hypothetical protein